MEIASPNRSDGAVTNDQGLIITGRLSRAVDHADMGERDDGVVEFYILFHPLVQASWLGGLRAEPSDGDAGHSDEGVNGRCYPTPGHACRFLQSGRRSFNVYREHSPPPAEAKTEIVRLRHQLRGRPEHLTALRLP